MNTSIRTFVPAITLSIIMLIGWEIVVSFFHINRQIVPSPTAILQALLNNFPVLAIHTGQTLLETVIGLLIAMFLGLATAILLDTSSWARRAVYPFLITSQTIPMIALAPLLLIWFGFDLGPKVIIVVLFCYFPIAITTANGFAQVDREFTDLLTSMNASYWKQLWLVRLPSSLPSFFSGLKIAATYAVTGAMVGEYVGAYQGLGVFIQTSANAHAIPLVFAIIFVTAITSLFLFGLVSLIEWVVLPWSRK